MAEFSTGISTATEAGPESPEVLLREGAREAADALAALEEAVVRDRQSVASLAGELAGCARDLQYERKWRGRDQLLNLATHLAARANAAEGGLGALLDQVAACQRLRDSHAELMEALSLLETELAPYAQALTSSDSAFDPTTPYGAFIPAFRLFASEMEVVAREFAARPAPDDFVEGSMHKRYLAAIERLAAPARSLAAPPPYVALYGLVSGARERLMKGVVLAKARADRDAAVLKSVEQVKSDLVSEFERVETLFAELEATKGGPDRFPSVPPPEPGAGPAPGGVPAGARRKGLFGRLKR